MSFDFLLPLAGDFRSNDVTSGSLTVTWSHVTSISVTWLPPLASFSLVKREMYSIREFLDFYSHFRGLPVKWHRFRVSFGHLRSRNIISCHVTGSSCGRPPCWKWNVQYVSFWPSTAASRYLPVKWRHFRVTSVTWGHVTLFLGTWLPSPARYSLVGSEMYRIREFLAFYSQFQVTYGEMTSLPGHFWSPEVTWRHFLSRDCLLLWGTALLDVKCTLYTSFWPSTATSSLLLVTWRHFRVTSCHLRPCDIIFCHVTASSCERPPCKKWNVKNWWVLAFYCNFQVISGQMTSLPGHFQSFEVTWSHLLSRESLLPRSTAL